MVSLGNPFKHKDEISPEQAEGAVAAEAEVQGADVQQFDENASPEEKSRQVAKAKEALRPRGEIAEKEAQKKAEEDSKLFRSVPTDLQGRKVRPSVNLHDVDVASRQAGQLGYDHYVPGALPYGQPSLNIPDWFTVGWIQASRSLLNLSPGELDDNMARMRDTDLVTTFLNDAYYGYFWTDGAALIGAVVVTYILTRFGGGWPMVIIVCSVIGTYYCSSIRRTRMRVRDDVSRELAGRRMLSENETARWMNHFMARFWLIYEPVLSATIVASVDEVLETQCPPFLDSLRLTTFTLGTKAPIIEYVRTLSDTEDDIIVMDWKVSFTPNDVQDLSVRQAARRVNPKVVLTVRVGKGMVGAGLPILLENMSFVGSLRFRFKLISSFPHIQMVDFCFMEQPSFDYELKPIGGSTLGLDVSALPGLSGFIQNQIHANLGPMMYFPNQFSLNLEELMSGTPLDASVGVLQITVWSARDIQSLKLTGGKPSPYVSLSLNDGIEAARTRTKESTMQPTFKETKHLMLKELQGLLTLTLMDDNGSSPASRLGATQFDLSTLAENPSPGQLNKAVLYNQREHGSIQYSVEFLPVLKPQTAPDGTVLPIPETNAGVMRLTLHQVRDLVKPSLIKGDLNSLAQLYLNDKLIKETPVIKNTNDPIFEDVTEFFVTDRLASVFSIHIVDDRKEDKRELLARLAVKVDDLVYAQKRRQDWYPCPLHGIERMRMSGQWKPIQMTGSINGSNSYRPSIGALKFWIRGAKDVKNVEALSGGKSDPYAVLRVNNLPVMGTAVVQNNLSPVWNQVLYAPVHTTAEVVRLEVLDYQTNTPDRTLGFCDIPVSELAEDNMEDKVYPFRTKGRRSLRERLKQANGTFKGLVDFDVEFLPAMHIEGANFIEQNKRFAAQEKERTGKDVEKNVVSPLDTPDARAETGAAVMAGQAISQNEGPDAQDDDDMMDGVRLSPSEIISSPSGILVFNMIDGHFTKKNVQLEVVFDDHYWPAYMTERRKKDYHWDEVGEVVIRELDVSNVWFRLRQGMSDDDVFAEYSCSTKQLLERALSEPVEITLNLLEGKNPTDYDLDPTQLMNMPNNMKDSFKVENLSNMPGKMTEKGTGAMTSGLDTMQGLAQGQFPSTASLLKITVSCRYIPMDVHLEPIESVVNQGMLGIEILNCTNLRSADMNGKSDPYVFFKDNGKALARSKTVRRTLNPTFNEDLGEVEIISRLTHRYTFDVRDFDQVSASDPLGTALVHIAELEPFQRYEHTYPLEGEGAKEDSTITVRLAFRPQYMNNRTGKRSNLANTAVSGVIGGIGGIGKGVSSGGRFIGRNFLGVGKKKSDITALEEAEEPVQHIQGVFSAQANQNDQNTMNSSRTSLHRAGDSMSQRGADSMSMTETASAMERKRSRFQLFKRNK